MLAGQFKDVTELLKKTFLCARVSQKERTVNHCHTPLNSEKQMFKIEGFPIGVE